MIEARRIKRTEILKRDREIAHLIMDHMGAEPFKLVTTRVDTLRFLTDAMKRKSFVAFCVEINNRIVGFHYCSNAEDNFPEPNSITKWAKKNKIKMSELGMGRSLYIHPNNRGNGVGLALLDKGFSHCLETYGIMGALIFRLDHKPDVNQPTDFFTGRHGFEKLDIDPIKIDVEVIENGKVEEATRYYDVHIKRKPDPVPIDPELGNRIDPKAIV